jgi:hypothetical protein
MMQALHRDKPKVEVKAETAPRQGVQDRSVIDAPRKPILKRRSRIRPKFLFRQRPSLGTELS